MKLKLKIVLGVLLCLILLYFSYFGLGSSTDKVIISSNADEEAIDVIDKTLKQHGFKGEYIIQPQSTSELGGKMIAEGTNIEADIVTQSTYYLESAQKENNMFANLKHTNKKSLDSYPNYITPLLGNMGALFVNTEALKEQRLETPKTIKDLTKPEYKNQVAMPNIMDSSTGWLVIQSVIGQYGDKAGEQMLTKLIKHVGPHLESSGSGPLEKVESGEAAVGFGLRAQVIDSENKGKPIHLIDPKEGNYSLVEGAAVVKKGGEKQEKAEEMVSIIQKYGRQDLLEKYPVPLYEKDKVAKDQLPAYPRKWEGKLTVDLLEKHQDLFNKAKKEAQNK